MNVEFDPAADREVNRTYRWYYKRSVTAAHRFLNALDHAIEQIVANPGLWPEHLHGTRFRNLERYPYFVVYLELGDSIKIIAVQHAARRPGYWIKRL
ncbi:type II toxin-antitoxin system RelE/ParE family toxin [Anatilimnocola floriformis]|uniref:type II toxin-antitoxin system RelE/ParE family toxin n=1 Tax=Anatilimnocola floriformis TaxID=2948575 RepID=UPI0020C22164|nr:type II toxin-antitoxin system RelE/ParE family toxin [Anatilimnocola floriformis]